MHSKGRTNRECEHRGKSVLTQRPVSVNTEASQCQCRGKLVLTQRKVSVLSGKSLRRNNFAVFAGYRLPQARPAPLVRWRHRHQPTILVPSERLTDTAAWRTFAAWERLLRGTRVALAHCAWPACRPCTFAGPSTFTDPCTTVTIRSPLTALKDYCIERPLYGMTTVCLP